MKTKIMRLARHSIVYGIGSSLGAAGSFLLIPLYTHALTPGEYGVLDLLYRSADILMLFMMLGVRQAYLRFYFDRGQSEEWHRIVTGTTVMFVLLSSVTVILLLYPFASMAHEGLFGTVITIWPIILILAWLPLEMLVNVMLTNLQAQTKSGAFVSINLVRLALFLSLNVALVWFYQHGVTGVLAAQVMATGLIAVAALVYFARSTRFAVSLVVMKDMIRFGLPYLPASFFMYIIANSDRYFLGIAGSLHALGVYALAAKIGMVGTMFMMDPFLKVWSPFLYEHYDKPDGPRLIGRVVTLFALASLAFGLLVSVVTPLVLPWIAGEQFLVAYNLVPIICLATVMYSLAHIADAGILIAKKTKHKPVIFGTAAAVAVAANAVLVPAFGALGAAVASMLAFTTLLAVNLIISNRYYHIPLELRRLALLFAASAVTYLLSLFILERAGGDWAMRACSLSALLLFPVILWATGFFTEGERELVRQIIGRRKGAVPE